ncbi:hypothetical protein GM658_28500 [Pseudoduganella eburnea]|uniref:HEAT repeat domain-containing protein n=1 Tax=Massilia eburnea TaxID=1776165 RepID=A0A6L6QR28_9BURK|nr:hypothetical protein [Massilia eburnea]MTW14561.1 hypothetical protein [Massilia eburnea]
MYEKYVYYLSSGFSDDYWSDLGSSEAASYLESFALEDWEMLAQDVQTKEPAWLQRCAQTLSDVDAPQALGLLLELLTHSNNDVVVAAADSLNALASMGHIIPLTEELKRKLSETKLNTDAIGRLVIESLEKLTCYPI